MRHAVPMDLAAVRAELEQMVRESDAVIAALSFEEDPEADESDLSADLAEADRDDALSEAAVVRREEATAAIARLDAGTFGACLDCGQQIVEERLLFRPEASRCLADQEAFEEREG